MKAAGGKSFSWGTVKVHGWLGKNEWNEKKHAVQKHSFGIITNQNIAPLLVEMESYELSYDLHLTESRRRRREKS